MKTCFQGKAAVWIAVNCILWTAASTVAVAADPPFVRGDANLDGQITIADASLIAELFRAGPPTLKCDDAADVYDDGVLAPGDLSAPGDVKNLLSWLFRADTASPLPIPPPFPARGVDPTADALNCKDSTIKPPIPPQPNYKIEWAGPAGVVRAQAGVELFLEATTGKAIDAFSIAYRFDRRVLHSVQVDFAGTILPAARRASFEASLYFRHEIYPSADPNYDVLIAGAIFVQPKTGGGGPLLEQILFPATAGPLEKQRLLRVTADIAPDAPQGAIQVLLPALPADLLNPALGWIYDEYVVSGARVPPGVESGKIIGVEGMEFLFVRGDSNHDTNVDISDVVFTLLYLFGGKQAPPCEIAADVQDDATIDMTDAIFTLDWLFRGGPEMAIPNLSTGCGETFVLSTDEHLDCGQSECQ